MIRLKNIFLSIKPLLFIYKTYYGLRYFAPKLKKLLLVSLKSKEVSTFTYKLTHYNQEYLLQNTSIVTGIPYEQVKNYADEILNNEELARYAKDKIRSSRFKKVKDLRCDFGSRISYYCIVRALKPKVVVENGVEMGYTGLILCEALRRNREENSLGNYYGFDINPEAGLLIDAPVYKPVGKMIYGESLDTLKKFEHPIDFYFSDGGRNPQYEKLEFELLEKKLSEKCVVVSNKLAFSNALSQLSIRLGKHHIFFQEEPLNHWYPGSQIGIMF